MPYHWYGLAKSLAQRRIFVQTAKSNNMQTCSMISKNMKERFKSSTEIKYNGTPVPCKPFHSGRHSSRKHDSLSVFILRFEILHQGRRILRYLDDKSKRSKEEVFLKIITLNIIADQ
jgi:hypothetical protein